MTRYIDTPNSISYEDIKNKEFNLSSSQYKKLVMPNQSFLFVRDFLSRKLQRKDLGVEVGSLSYIDKSPNKFIRTKALQPHFYLPEINDDTTPSILPSDFIQMNLRKGDLLISKDGNIGEIAILDKDYPNFMLSGAIYKLPVKDEWKYYLLSIIKHDIFREQLDFMVPKGATIRHAKDRFLDCKIPLPTSNTGNVIKFISILTEAIVNKEKLIKQRHSEIMRTIATELMQNQKPQNFIYKLPQIDEIKQVGRLDASLYKVFFKKGMFQVLNYIHGCKPLTEQHLELKPGPSLEVKLLGTRIDSSVPVKGFYRLITPKQITNCGILKNDEYIGTPAKIDNIKFGDILFGESGTGRTMVFLDQDNITINNAHAHILRSRLNNDLNRIITIRSILQYYKETGITDCLTVGGAGGHLSPSYFDRIMIPNFPGNKQEEIAKMYYNKKEYNTCDFSLDNFIQKDNDYNINAGIYELDKTAKQLKVILNNSINNIVNAKEVNIHFSI